MGKLSTHYCSFWVKILGLWGRRPCSGSLLEVRQWCFQCWLSVLWQTELWSLLQNQVWQHSFQLSTLLYSQGPGGQTQCQYYRASKRVWNPYRKSASLLVTDWWSSQHRWSRDPDILPLQPSASRICTLHLARIRLDHDFLSFAILKLLLNAPVSSWLVSLFLDLPCLCMSRIWAQPKMQHSIKVIWALRGESKLVSLWIYRGWEQEVRRSEHLGTTRYPSLEPT